MRVNSWNTVIIADLVFHYEGLPHPFLGFWAVSFQQYVHTGVRGHAVPILSREVTNRPSISLLATSPAPRTHNTHSFTHTLSLTYIHSQTLSHILILSLTCTYTHKYTLSYTNPLTCTHTHRHTPTLSFTSTYTHRYIINPLSHFYTHSHPPF